jgi:hypothetical protein
MGLDAGFEHDLRSWVDQIYERAELQARSEDRRAAERVVERQNRIYLGLIIVLAGSIGLLPWAGPGVVIAALVVLYVGALVTSSFTALKIRRLEHTVGRYERIRREGEAAWAARPGLEPDDRAQLVRIMNLSRIAASSGGRAALAEELAAAGRQPRLAEWCALRDAEVLLRDRPRAPDGDD